MSSKSRYVFDTNVIISALLFEQSTPARAFSEALDRRGILLSDPLCPGNLPVFYEGRINRRPFVQCLPTGSLARRTLLEVTVPGESKIADDKD